MKRKYEFKNIVAETLLIPLYMRAKESRRKDAILKATYLLAAGNLYVATYRIHPSGVVKADYTLTSTDMEAVKTELSEATLTATFTPDRL